MKDKPEKGISKTDQEGIVPYYKLFCFATILDKLLILIGLTAAVIAGAMQPFMMILFGDASGIIVNYADVTHSQNLSDTEHEAATQTMYDGVERFAIYTSVSAFVVIIATYISGVTLTFSSLRQIFKMRKLFLEKTLNQDISWYDQNQNGDFSSVITDNIPKIEDGIGEKVGIFIFFFATFLIGLIWALVRGWKLALVCLASFPLQFSVMGAIAWFSAKYCKQEMEAYGGAGAVAEEVLGSIRTVVAFDGQNEECRRYETFVNQAKTNNIKRAFFNALNQGFIWFLTYGCYALAFWYGVGLVIEERILDEDERVYTPGNMISVFFCTLIASWNFGSLGPLLEVFGMSRGAAHKVFSVLNSQPIMHRLNNCGRKVSFKSDIIYKNVKFCYPSRSDVQVLKDINMCIKFGETVALVGHSGSGKSTIVQLLQRFYDPTSGSITVDGTNLKDVNLSHLRQNVGVVSQEPSLFATTIADNIRYGKLDATDKEIIEAAKKANVHKFIQNLPHGYRTVIGERGAQLSGGQKQRIAIARALIKQPNLLILDEATSALDTESEVEVQAALDAITSSCTKIVIAHRLSTIRNADRIIVFDKGEIVEQGSHQTLIESKGVYHQMINAQGFTDISQEVAKRNEENKRQRVKSMTFSSNGDVFEDIEDDVFKMEHKEMGTLSVLVKIMKTNKPESIALVAGCLASIVNGASLPLYGLVFGDIMGVLSINDSLVVRENANYYCLDFLYLGIATGLSMFIQFFAFGYAGEKLTYRLRNRMFASMLHQEIGWFDRKENGTGALCAQLSGDAASVQGAGGSRAGLVINSLSTLFLSVIFGMILEWRLTFIGLAFYPLVLLPMYYEKKYETDGGDSQKFLEKSAKIAVEAIENIRTVKALGCEYVFCEEYTKHLTLCKKVSLKRSHIRSLILGCARSLMMFAYAPGLAYGAKLIAREKIESQVVFQVLEVVIASSWSIGNALTFSSNMQAGLTAAARIFTLIARVPLIKNPPDGTDPEWERGTVNYSQIFFSYPTRPSMQVLNGLNLSVMQGKTVALVGGSGCGKSTIIQLLERFYDPNYGEVNVDGDDLKTVNLRSLRSHLGIVSQEPNLFDRTIAENIGYGANDRVVPQCEIEAAAKAANIHKFITSLPLGYETKLGSRGTQLSGGQKQRLAIARALLRNPKILLLDEATSALDNESEKIVQEALDNARKGRTCITIAHRLTTIQDADVICVLKEGRIAEMGNHSQLLALQGLYFNYYKLQSGQA